MNLNFGLDKKRKNAYAFLPHGAVKANSWLESQLEMMRDGITGEMEKYPDYVESEWLGRDRGENWERGPYYLRGLVAMAYVLDDDTLKAKADRWINAIIASQRNGGMFGPRSNEDWWSRMPVLMALRDYLEALEYRGMDDPRVIPFITEYLEYQAENLPKLPLESWAKARGGDNIDSVYWLYNRLYDENDPGKTEWLLRLAKLLRDQTDDWSYIMNETTVRTHVVNTSQALKMPVLYYQQSGNEYDREAFENALLNISIDHGRIDTLPNADEAARDNRSTRGSELCGIVEGMLSTEIALRILGEPWIADRLERIAYNALPSGYSYDYLSHVYFILQNQVMATNGYHEFDCDHGDSSAFGAPCGFDCCFANNHMGWANFVRSMWMAKNDGGIAALCYGPCSVKYGDISFTEKTDYPFRDKIEFTYTGKTSTFGFSLRIPEWCKAPSLTVNGKKIEVKQGSICEIGREWRPGDTLILVLPMESKRVSGYNSSTAITRGPLIYSLPIKENWIDLENNNNREIKMNTFGKLRNREVRPSSAWNYALEDGMEYVEYPGIPAHPFTPAGAPCAIKVRGSRVRGWKLDGNIAAVQPCGAGSAGSEELTLIPYGCTRLKITHFPAKKRTTVFKPDRIVRNGRQILEFANVTVPKAADHTIVLRGSGKGSIQINKIYTSDIVFEDGEYIIHSAKGLIGDPARAFSNEHYNNIRIYGCEVESLEVLPVSEYRKISLREITVKSRTVIFATDADRSFCSLRARYGSDPKALDNLIEGFRQGRAVINSLEPGSEYYFRLEAEYGDRTVSSGILKLATLDCEEELFEPASFRISCESAFESVIVTFERVTNAAYYEIEVKNKSGAVIKRISGVRFNPYKGSGIFESDRTAFTLEESGVYSVFMSAYSKDDRLLSRSAEARVRV